LAAKEGLAVDYCEICGFDLFVQKHRIVPGREGGKYKLGNVISLCGNCHWFADRDVFSRSFLLTIVADRIGLHSRVRYAPWGYKKCIVCLQVKPLTNFHKMAQMKDGHRPTCSLCRNLLRRKGTIISLKEIRKKNRDWKVKVLTSLEKHRIEVWKTNMDKQYNLTPEEYDQLYDESVIQGFKSNFAQ